MKKYLIALPCFPNRKGFNHPTILVSAKDENATSQCFFSEHVLRMLLRHAEEIYYESVR